MNPGTVTVGFLHPGHWSACFGRSLIDLYLTDASVGRHRVIHDLPLFCASGGIPAGRNKIARDFLDRTDCEWLWMVDSDMGFGPATIDDLIAAADPETRPVVGGLCFCLRAGGLGPFYGDRFVIVPSAFEWADTQSEFGFRPILSLPEDDLLKVDATGAACLLIHRGALERLRATWGDRWFDPFTHPGPPVTTISEDLSFCIRLAAEGIPIYIHTGVGTTHDKGGIFLDRDAYEAQNPLVAAGAGA